MSELLQHCLDLLASKQRQLQRPVQYKYYGKVVSITGSVIEVSGLKLPIGSTCYIERHDDQTSQLVAAEVVGFKYSHLLLMPLENISGILPHARVSTAADHVLSGNKLFPLGEELLGRVLDGNGKPLDEFSELATLEQASLFTTPINPLQREPINETLDVGIRAINGLLTVGKGQRIGLFAGSGVGKSVLLGMMARYTAADIIVVGLIGERGREVKEFIEDILGTEGLARSVVVAVPADISPLLRMQGACYATRIAEYFRDQGRDVLLIMDSLTRYAMAQREVALSVGEPPATKGYPPSVFTKLSSLVEKAGNGAKNGGSITAFYTVLSEGDDQQDPIADSARAILDGHIVLSRSLAEAGHYPAIDVETSISRVMTVLISQTEWQQVQKFKQLIAHYQRNRDLISVGAYSMGSDPLLDQAIALYPQLCVYLQQGINERSDVVEAQERLAQLFKMA